MAIVQCWEFFVMYLNIRLVEMVDIVFSVWEISENGWLYIGVIVSIFVVEMYGFEIIVLGIEINKKNYIWFLVLEKGMFKLDVVLEKVFIFFVIDYEVGSLYKAFVVMAVYNVNLIKIQLAFIIGYFWEYQFYVDFVVQGKVGYEQAFDVIWLLICNLQVYGVYVCGEYYEY